MTRKPSQQILLQTGIETSYKNHNSHLACEKYIHQALNLRGQPFDSWGGGYGFFVKKKIVQQIFENK